MDTLALLCNLHADGPSTLQRLRRAGCENLLALRRVEAERLAEWLGWNARTAERFLREAALLCERVEPEVGGASEPAFELESSLAEELGDPRAEGEDEDLAADEEQVPEPGPERMPSAAGVGEVLGAWRELDRVAPPGDPEAFVIPRPPPPADRRLEGVHIEGLDEALRARLAALGLRTLRQLVDSPPVETARALDLGFTRFARLQFLARGELEQLAETGVEAEPSRPPFRSFEPPPHEPFETAGPFA
jgi:hypothetical protein